jgi:hypothetical protein
VAAHVQGGKLDARCHVRPALEGLRQGADLEGANIDLSIGTWRGLAVHKATPPDVVTRCARRLAKRPKSRCFASSSETNLSWHCLDAEAFEQAMRRDLVFKQLVQKLGIKAWRPNTARRPVGRRAPDAFLMEALRVNTPFMTASCRRSCCICRLRREFVAWLPTVKPRCRAS